MAKNIEIGRFGEKTASIYLKKNGYLILDNNFRCNLGEVDIIARHRDTIVFIEVKTRKSNLYGTPAQAVNRSKQNKIIKTALYYLKINNKFNDNIRFDIVEVWHKDYKLLDVNIIQNAFNLPSSL